MKTTLPMRFLFSLGLACLIFCGTVCEKNETKRHYQEIVIPSPLEGSAGAKEDPHALLKTMLARGEDPHAFMREPQPGTDAGAGMAGAEQLPMPAPSALSLTWSVPEGWNEEAGQGMRLATFTADSPNGIECTIVSLSGNAGGLDANVVRWMGQLKLEVPPDEVFDDFLSRQEKLTTANGAAFLLVDLTGLQPQADPASPTMLAAMGEINGTTVFAKMTGSIAAVQKNQDKFKTLCRSLKVKE